MKSILSFNPLPHRDAFDHVFENIMENALLEQMLHYP